MNGDNNNENNQVTSQTERVKPKQLARRHVKRVLSQAKQTIKVQDKEIEAKHKEAQEAIKRATHDKLTGLLNKEGFDEMLDVEVEKAIAEGTILEALYIDLNNLKKVNDAPPPQGGHEAGNQLLRDTASSLLASIRTSDGRPSDTVARVGGDEFVVVLSGKKEGDRDFPFSQSYCSRLLPMLAGKGISLSIGVSKVDLKNPHSSIAAADALMFQAKDKSRETNISEVVYSK